MGPPRPTKQSGSKDRDASELRDTAIGAIRPYHHTYGMPVKRTFVLDEESAVYLDRTASRLGVPKSWVVREALRAYGEQLGRLTNEERDQALAAFDRAIADVPARPRAEVEAELDQLVVARRRGGRKRA